MVVGVKAPFASPPVLPDGKSCFEISNRLITKRKQKNPLRFSKVFGRNFESEGISHVVGQQTNLCKVRNTIPWNVPWGICVDPWYVFLKWKALPPEQLPYWQHRLYESNAAILVAYVDFFSMKQCVAFERGNTRVWLKRMCRDVGHATDVAQGTGDIRYLGVVLSGVGRSTLLSSPFM